jgi:hypothetical protein
MNINAVTNEQALTAPLLAYPLIVIAVWQSAPPLRVFATLGWLTIITAAGSLVLGIRSPDLVTLSNAGFIEKVVFVDQAALAGPFSHPNTFGSVLALGLPSVLLISNRRVKVAGFALIAVAVGWSASRTSIGTVLALLALLMLTRAYATGSVRRFVTRSGVVASVAVLCWLPLTATDASFNYRGSVWAGSLVRWKADAWTGGGPNAFREQGRFSNYLGEYAFHGHNLLMDALVVGGLAYVVVLGAVVAGLASRAGKAWAAGALLPIAFTVAFLVNGMLEVSTNFWLPSPTGLVVWFSVCAVLFAFPGTVPPDVSPDHASAGGSVLGVGQPPPRPQRAAHVPGVFRRVPAGGRFEGTG